MKTISPTHTALPTTTLPNHFLPHKIHLFIAKSHTFYSISIHLLYKNMKFSKTKPALCKDETPPKIVALLKMEGVRQKREVVVNGVD
jgi:hypothetical protein